MNLKDKTVPLNILLVEIPKSRGGDYKNILRVTLDEFVELSTGERNDSDLIEVTLPDRKMVIAKDKFGDRQMSYAELHVLHESINCPEVSEETVPSKGRKGVAPPRSR
jgi:hypothetical protein